MEGTVESGIERGRDKGAKNSRDRGVKKDAA
jgi:hypothetical protein